MSLGEYLYVVRNQVLARGPSGRCGAFSRILSCPSCGTAGWGRIVYEGPSEGYASWRSCDSICPKCPGGASPWFPAGSFLQALRLYTSGMGEDLDWSNHLPPEMIEWEAQCAMKYFKEKHRATIVDQR